MFDWLIEQFRSFANWVGLLFSAEEEFNNSSVRPTITVQETDIFRNNEALNGLILDANANKTKVNRLKNLA